MAVSAHDPDEQRHSELAVMIAFFAGHHVQINAKSVLDEPGTLAVDLLAVLVQRLKGRQNGARLAIQRILERKERRALNGTVDGHVVRQVFGIHTARQQWRTVTRRLGVAAAFDSNTRVANNRHPKGVRGLGPDKQNSCLPLCPCKKVRPAAASLWQKLEDHVPYTGEARVALTPVDRKPRF